MFHKLNSSRKLERKLIQLNINITYIFVKLGTIIGISKIDGDVKCVAYDNLSYLSIKSIIKFDVQYIKITQWPLKNKFFESESFHYFLPCLGSREFFAKTTGLSPAEANELMLQGRH
uniref:Uncharacterized protein n=1 Tax=Rhizophagus irregularis (strain DAOM 181602 / DAOM 197198 / MUCL 43194) TaxID=747089 RepID=U9TTU3_RHIID